MALQHICLFTVAFAVIGAQGASLTGQRSNSHLEDDTTIEIGQGLLRGLTLTSRGGRNYLAFLGVPYAKPPLGALRFRAPEKAEPWVGTLNATEIPPMCIQKAGFLRADETWGSEDCLQLCVYTPRNVSELENSSLPVIFYLHGGGPTGSAARYGGDYLMDEDVIFITVHYRLGALGNFDTEDLSARGNQGTRDMIIGLQWVQENIHHFGGDKNRVTIMGNSYGGFYVHMLLMSPLASGLFHQAISQSPAAFFALQIPDDPREIAFQLAATLNCTYPSSLQMVNCLRNVDADKLAIASIDFDFTNSVDLASAENDRFLPARPMELLRNGQFSKVPAMFGINSGEVLGLSLMILLSPDDTNDMNENWAESVTNYLMLGITSNDPHVIANALRGPYFGNVLVGRATEGNLTNMISDRLFNHPLKVFAKFQNDYNNPGQNVYIYHFDRKVPRKYTALLEEIYQPDHFLGASHADELQLLFPYDDFPYVPQDDPEYFEISKTMVKLWVSFISTGKPTGTVEEWLPFNSSSTTSQWFQIDDSPRMTQDLDERMRTWDMFDLDELYTPIANVKPDIYKKIRDMGLF